MANYRNRAILREARQHSCQGCGADDGTIVAAHSNQGRHGKGMGIKAHDLPAYLCHRCHTFVDQGKAPAELRNELWRSALIKSVPLYEHLLDDEGRMLLREMM